MSEQHSCIVRTYRITDPTILGSEYFVFNGKIEGEYKEYNDDKVVMSIHYCIDDKNEGTVKCQI